MFYKYVFSFRKKTFLIHLILFIVCLAIFCSFAGRLVDRVTAHSIVRRTGEVIRKIHKAPNVESMVEYLHTEKSFVFYRMTLFDHHGRSIYDTHFPSMNDSDHDLEVMQAIKYGDGYETRYSPLFRQSMAYSALSFLSHGQEYVLRIGMPFSEIRKLSLDFEIAFLSLGVVLFFLYGFVIWLLIHRLTRPIQQIVTAIQPYQEGKAEFIPKIEIDPKIQAKSEFSRLAQVFNTLNDRIRKQIAHLIEQQERTKDILDSLGEGVIAVDINQVITFANQAACRMLGISYDTLVGRKFFEIQASRRGLASQCQELLKLTLERMETTTHTYTIEESQRIYLDLISVPQTKHGGMILVLQDKTSDYEVIEMGKDFIANASHELRTPITVIRGFAEMLHDLPDLNQLQAKEITEKVFKTSLRLEALVKSLLALADIENLNEEQFERVDLISLAENCRQQLLSAHPQVNIQIHKKVNQALIFADADLVSMAVMNLLENAVKYSPAPASIDLIVDHSQENVQLQIKDSGIGIPEADLPRIFNRFYTVNKARSRKFGGTGLGLSIVKSIIQKHRGEISVVSQLGEGSAFTIYLPAKP